MDEPSFTGLLLVIGVAFAAPFLLGLAPGVRLSSVVFEIVAGIVIGPSVLGWVEVEDNRRAVDRRARVPAVPRRARDRPRSLGALFATTSAALMLPIFLAALLAVRGLPAIAYRRLVGTRRVPVAALLQATSLPFIVAATAIGQELGLMEPAEGAALIGAGLLSVLIFPVSALGLLRRAVAGDGGTDSVGAARP